LYANHADGGYADTRDVWGMQYCCLTDANDFSGGNPQGTMAIFGAAQFAYAKVVGNFHRRTIHRAKCRKQYRHRNGEVDIDQDDRILWAVDIGATGGL
jgi:hypothetical protein